MATMDTKANLSDKSEGPMAASMSYQEGHVSEVLKNENNQLHELGYESELRRNRSLFTMLFQSLAIAAVCFEFPFRKRN